MVAKDMDLSMASSPCTITDVCTVIELRPGLELTTQRLIFFLLAQARVNWTAPLYPRVETHRAGKVASVSLTSRTAFLLGKCPKKS